MNIDREVLKHLPRAFQVWREIEQEAEKRAEARFQEIIEKKGKPCGQAGRREHHKSSTQELVAPATP